jgi:hypothetical protein
MENYSAIIKLEKKYTEKAVEIFLTSFKLTRDKLNEKIKNKKYINILDATRAILKIVYGYLKETYPVIDIEKETFKAIGYYICLKNERLLLEKSFKLLKHEFLPHVKEWQNGNLY